MRTEAIYWDNKYEDEELREFEMYLAEQERDYENEVLKDIDEMDGYVLEKEYVGTPCVVTTDNYEVYGVYIGDIVYLVHTESGTYDISRVSTLGWYRSVEDEEWYTPNHRYLYMNNKYCIPITYYNK